MSSGTVPLADINDENVGGLGLAWYWNTGDARGLEATPIVVDGVMFSTGTWSRVYANDGRTGELIWQYDPEVPKEWGKVRLLRRGEPRRRGVEGTRLCRDD